MKFTQNVDGLVIADAEHGELTAGDAFYWRLVDSTGADGGKALKPTGQTWDRTLAGYVDYTFEITTAGNYSLFFYLNTAGREGKIWVELNGQLNAVGPNASGRLYFRTSSYSWQNGYDNALVSLAAGTHKLRIRSLTSSVQLDRIAVVPQGSTEITAGMTGAGGADTGTGTVPEIVAPDVYAEWLISGGSGGTLLVNLGHSTGTVYLGSRAYLSEQNEAHDNWMIAAPTMEYSLLSLVDGVGDIEAYLPPDVGVDWANKDWRGHRCEWYYGAEDWEKSEFRLIASATIQGIKKTGPRKYKFELIGDIQNYNRTYYSGDTTKTLDVQAMIEWVCSEGGMPAPSFVNMDNGELDIMTTIDVSDSSTMYADIKKVARSVGAYPRPNQFGELEIVKPDTSGDVTFTVDGSYIERGTLVEVDQIPAYKRVTITYGTGDDRVSGETTAITGAMDEEIVIETALQSSTDANDLLAIELVRHAKPQKLWGMNVFHLTPLMREGDYISVDDDELQGSGVITTLKPSLDSARGYIEVLM